MKKKLIIGIAASVATVLSLAATAQVTSLVLSNSQDPTDLQSKNDIDKTFVIEGINDGAFRTFSLRINDDTDSYTFVSGSAIDVSTLIFSNGVFSNGNSDRGGFVLERGDQQYFFYSFDGYGTETITFPEPLRIRSGDRLVIGTRNGTNLQGELDFTFIGRDPASVTSKFSVN